MKRLLVWVGCCLALGLVGAPRSYAEETLTFSLDEVSEGAAEESGGESGDERQPASIAASLDGLSWGMSKEGVFKLLKRRIRADFEKQVKAERDIVRQDALYQEAKQRYLRMREGFVKFDGKKTGWDVSPLVEEFRHGSNESLLVVESESAREHYFFINERLYKWYRELKPAAFDGAAADYGRLAERLRKDFGKGKPQVARRNEGGEPLTGVAFKDEQTSVTLLKRGAETCLVYEELATLDRLAVLREHAHPRGPKANGALDMVLMTAAQREAWREQQDREGARRAQAARKD